MRDPPVARLRAVPSGNEPLALVHPAPEPRTGWVLAILLAVALAPRLVLLPLNENLYGDAVARTELAERWAEDPHWITSFQDGALQFGPLHLYVMGLALKLWPVREHAGRAISLLFGTLSVVPLYLLTRRLFGWRAGVWSSLALSAWSIHLQLSTTAASEALSLFLLLWMLALFAEGWAERRFSPIAYSALLLNLACATRYDAWMLVPLFCVLLLLGDRDRVAALTRAVLFGLLCLPFPLAWMHGNELQTGDPLYPLRFVDAFHRQWVVQETARWGSLVLRLEALAFWPSMALATLTPPVALFGAAGMARAWRERPEHRWLLWSCWVPAAYFTFRGAVLLDFVPLARFTVPQLALLLPYVEPGFHALLGRASAWLRRAALFASVALAACFPLWLGAFTFHREGKLEDALRSISPTSTNPRALMQVASFLRREVAPRGVWTAVDSSSRYEDLQLVFFGGIRDLHASHRWPNFAEAVAAHPPGYLVRIDRGTLSSALALSPDGRKAKLGALEFEELPGFSPPFHVYRRQEPQGPR